MGANKVNEDTILEDFKRYHEVCERENKILIASLNRETWDAINKNSQNAKLGGRPKGKPAWNKGQGKKA